MARGGWPRIRARRPLNTQGQLLPSHLHCPGAVQARPWEANLSPAVSLVLYASCHTITPCILHVLKSSELHL